MKTLITILFLLILNCITIAQIGVNAPLLNAGSCTSGCVTSIQLGISQADGSTEGTVTASDQAFGGIKSFEDGIDFLSTTSGSTIGFYTTPGTGTEPFIRTGGGMDESLFIGRNAGAAGAGGNGNTGIGTNALESLNSTTTGSHNTAIGWYALRSATTARWNTMVGDRAGESLTTSTGSDANTGMGWDVMEDATTAANNAAFGSEAGNHLTTGDFNTFLGSRAGAGVVGSSSGNSNTFVGYQSGVSFTSCANNTMVGIRSGEAVTSGSDNTGIGYDAIKNITLGHDNVALGGEAGLALTVGLNNTFIGRLAGSTTTSGANNIMIGENVIASTAFVSSEINIGDTWYGNISSQNLGVGVSSPSATLHLKAGTTSPNSAPIKFTSGSLMTTTEAATIEYDGKAFLCEKIKYRDVRNDQTITQMKEKIAKIRKLRSGKISLPNKAKLQTEDQRKNWIWISKSALDE